MTAYKHAHNASDYVNYCLEILAPCGAITARAMFGGHGLYRNGLIFGLIADDVLYFKVDSQSQQAYRAYGSTPFTYEKNGKTYAMSYYQVPGTVLENTVLLATFVDEACAISRQKKKK